MKSLRDTQNDSPPLVQCPFGREKEEEAPLRPTERQPEKREKNPALAEGGRGFCLQTTRNDDILGMKVDRGRRRGRGEEEEGGRDGFPKENSFFLLSLSHSEQLRPILPPSLAQPFFLLSFRQQQRGRSAMESSHLHSYVRKAATTRLCFTTG